MVIADAGYWIALFNPRDRWHERAISASEHYEREGFITTDAVVAEACHLLRQRVNAGVMIGLLNAMKDNEVKFFTPPPELLGRTIQLMQKYQDLPMDYADASMVLLAEYLGHGRILSTDVRDFGAYRWKSRNPFQNLLEEST